MKVSVLLLSSLPPPMPPGDIVPRVGWLIGGAGRSGAVETFHHDPRNISGCGAEDTVRDAGVSSEC